MKVFKCILIILVAFGSIIQSIDAQSISGVVNDYAKVSFVGTNSVNVAAPYSPAPFNAGEKVLLIQMKGASVDSTNTASYGAISNYGSAGNYEVLTIIGRDANIIFFECDIIRDYDPALFVQLVRIPVYPNPTVVATLTAGPWDGNAGGILALETPGTLTLNSNINVSELGFRGGIQDTNPDGSCGSGYADYFYNLASGAGAEKGEGIAITIPGQEVGKGAMANGGGGGNKHNSGGAGGGNFTMGGQGGNLASFCSFGNAGGLGAYSLSYNLSDNKVFLGGGGGAGDHNDLAGAYSGGNGGGMIFLNANTIEGNNNKIQSNGTSVPLIPNSLGDGAGGGGAGGTILLDVSSYGTTNIQLEANGGNGGSQNVSYPACFGPGGGGGTGFVWVSGGGVPSNVNFQTLFGDAGVDVNPTSMCMGESYGAEPGNEGEGFLPEFTPLYNECSVPCDPTVPDTCCNAVVDVIFLLDNSGSVSTSEFNGMITLAQNSILEIDSAYCDALFAVTHYAGYCGDEIHIEHDFTTATTAQSITRPSTFSSGGDDLNEALGTLSNAIDGTANPLIVSGITSLSGRAGAVTLLVVFTDAGAYATPSSGCIGGGSAMKPYNNSNLLKSSPYNIGITLVHFEPTLANVQSVGAAISSNGGAYSGVVDANVDPVSNALPRQFIVANFGSTTLNILNSTPPCDSLVPFVCCDDLSVITNDDPNPNACCYDLDLTNNVGSSITCFEVEMLSTDWQFNTGSLAVGSGFGWQSTPTNSKLIIEHSSGAIPAGPSPNALEYCVAPTTASPSTTVTLIYRWYQILPDGSKREVCTETIERQCDPPVPGPCLNMDDITVACNPDNPYEYFVNFTVINNSSFDADKIVLEDLDPGFAFSFCSVSSPTNIIAIPTSPNPLPSGATSTTMCVKIIAPNPVWSPTDVCFDLGLFGEFDCCHSADSVCITLENCCNPCDERDLVIDELQTDSADCCYSLDIVDSCGYAFFTKVETEIITPGVIFGYHALGGPDAANWFVLANSSQTSITWWNYNSYIPFGTTQDIMQFCLSGITDPSQVPQEVVVKWYAQNSAGEDYIACTDTLEFECEVPPLDYSCLNISDREIECVEDSSKYRYTFTVTNTSTIPFSADYLDVSILAPASVYFSPSGGIFPLPTPFNPGDSHQVTACIETTGTFPVAPQDLVLRYRLRYAMGDTCCYNTQLDTLFIPPCGPADCDSLVVSIDQSTSDSCCHTLDFNNLYTDPIYTIELEVLTVGVIFGNHATGGSSPSNWHNPLSTATKIQWALLSGNQLPYGTTAYDDLVNFCLDGIDPGETPQDVVVRWLDGDSMVVCTDTLTFDCIDDYNCVDLTDTQLYCEENGDYNFTFTVVNNSNPAHVADMLKIRPVPPINPIQFANGSFLLSPALNFGNSFTGSTTITGAVPGDTLKFEMRMEDTTSGDSWCCFESDTFSIVIPSCCCSDSTSFYDLVDMGFDTLAVCDTFTVKGLALDSCHQVTWTWGDGTADTGPISGDSTVTHDFGWPGVYNVCMEVENVDADGNLCWEETYCEDITVESCCNLNTIVVNNGLTPNGDGFNDEFKIVGVEQCKSVGITIYNRWGNVVYKQSDYELGPNWDGVSKMEKALPQGTYYYIIEFKDLGEKKAGYLDVRY